MCLSCALRVVQVSDFHEPASADFLVFSPPGVLRGGCPVRAALDIAIVGLSALAGPDTLPPVKWVQVHLLEEVMVERDIVPGQPIDALHLLAEVQACSSQPLLWVTHR